MCDLLSLEHVEIVPAQTTTSEYACTLIKTWYNAKQSNNYLSGTKKLTSIKSQVLVETFLTFGPTASWTALPTTFVIGLESDSLPGVFLSAGF